MFFPVLRNCLAHPRGSPQRPPATSTPGSRWQQGAHWDAMGCDGTRGLGQQRPRPVRSTRQISDPLRREGDPLRCGRSTQQRSVPLALASLVLGSRRSETGLFEIGFGELARARRGHEALFTRRGRIDASTSTHRRPTQPSETRGFLLGPSQPKQVCAGATPTDPTQPTQPLRPAGPASI
jgi:hypothetical protein